MLSILNLLDNAIALSGVNPLVDVFKTSAESVKTDVMSFVAIALPIGLGIFGTFMAIRLGKKFFKSVAN